MDHENDVAYYRQREARARGMAAAASDVQVRRIHSDMADRYAAKVLEMAGRSRLRVV